jgi:hypothetical protein
MTTRIGGTLEAPEREARYALAVDRAVHHRRAVLVAEAIGHFLRCGAPGPSAFQRRPK